MMEDRYPRELQRKRIRDERGGKRKRGTRICGSRIVDLKTRTSAAGYFGAVKWGKVVAILSTVSEVWRKKNLNKIGG